MGDRQRRLGFRPVEGWLSVLSLLAMLLALGLAVDEARWAGVVPGSSRSETAFLPAALMLGAAWGFASAKLRWRTFPSHLVGAALGAAFAILAVADAIPAVQGSVAAPPGVPLRIGNLVLSLEFFVRDVLVRQVRSDQTSAFLLLVAAVGWSTGQFAASAVYRHRRPMSAVVFPGLLLLANMSLTPLRELPYLVAFSAAALVLLVRSSLSEQRFLWGLGRLGDADSASSLYVRNGLAFITIAVVGSLALMNAASSDPLRPFLAGRANDFADWATQFNVVTSGIVGSVRVPAGGYGTSTTIRGFWDASPALVLRVQSSDGEAHYLRGATYDSFDGQTWSQTDRAVSDAVPAGQPVLGASSDRVVAGQGVREVTVTVAPVDTGGNVVLAPATPERISRPVRIRTQSPGGPLDAVLLVDPLPEGGSYQVTSLVPDATEAVTANELAAAGVTYPGWARDYVRIEPGSIGPIVAQTADRVAAGLPEAERDPYHVAKALQDYLYGGGRFIYRTDVRGLCAPGTSVADCLLVSRQGYCEYFATALVMMLRTQQIPARYVVGYLPGRPTGDGRFDVDRSAAHAWVEVYFPRYGWVQFDPTPGNTQNGQVATDLPAGAPVRTPSPRPGATSRPYPRPSFIGGTGDTDGIARRPGALGPGTTGTSAGAQWFGSPFAVSFVISLLALVVAGLVWARRRHAPPLSADRAYAAVTRLAARLGFPRRPSETPYEYAALLGNVLPSARVSLEMLARAKVESDYGHRELATERIAAVRQAYGRLRVNLLRLALARPRRHR